MDPKATHSNIDHIFDETMKRLAETDFADEKVKTSICTCLL